MIEETLRFEAGDKEGKKIDYIIYYPENMNNTPLPLLLFLHGIGERGGEIESIKRHGIPKIISGGKNFPFICIAPQCPKDGYWIQNEYVLLLIGLINHIKKTHNIDRVFGTGLSMGGFGILEVAINEPGLFNAIIPICVGANFSKLDRIKNLPIWLFHGRKDDVITVDSSI